MKNERINNWLAAMKPIEEVQQDTYPTLHLLNEKAWELSHLQEPLGENSIHEKWSQLSKDSHTVVTDVVLKADEEDLLEVQGMTDKELRTRKGMLLLEQTRDTVCTQIRDTYIQLMKFQAVREHGLIEVERRHRAQMIKDGHMPDNLDAFTSRFLFGAKPAPLSLPGKPPLPRNFVMCRTPSGKQVAVEEIWFDFPSMYNKTLMDVLEKEELYKKPSYYYEGYEDNIPHRVEMPIAQSYYRYGFKPKKEVTGHFRVGQWHGYIDGDHWHLSHTRSYKTSELTPLD